MKNPQSRHYKSYFIQKGNDYIPCTHEECFAPGELPTLENPYKQRWYYAEDFSQAVRLERSARGQAWYNANDSSLKRIERQDEQLKDIWELDRPSESEEGLPFGFEIPCSENVEEIVTRIEELRILLSVLETLSAENRELWDMLIAGTKKKDIAEHFGLTTDGVFYREKKLREILGSDKILNAWFEKS